MGRLPDEFALIHRYFAPLAAGVAGASGLTDDVCTYAPPPGHDLVLTTDALVAGVHFRQDDPPDLVARKMLRVNLSDLAGKGAKPVGYLMTTAFDASVDEAWLAAFVRGLAEDQATFQIGLMGGDTVATPGPISLSLTALGILPVGTAPRRGDAKAGDRILVSGTLGDAAFGLRLLQGTSWPLSDPVRQYLIGRYRLPEPRLALGQALRQSGSVHAMMDVSDGLVADLGHICAASGLGARVRAQAAPVSSAGASILAFAPDLLSLVLAHGDDYELLLTAPEAEVDRLVGLAGQVGVDLVEIGEMSPGSGVAVLDRDGHALDLGRGGFRHF
jgi:thiamine-monophosphate kinase